MNMYDHQTLKEKAIPHTKPIINIRIFGYLMMEWHQPKLLTPAKIFKMYNKSFNRRIMSIEEFTQTLINQKNYISFNCIIHAVRKHFQRRSTKPIHVLSFRTVNGYTVRKIDKVRDLKYHSKYKGVNDARSF